MHQRNYFEVISSVWSSQIQIESNIHHEIYAYFSQFLLTGLFYYSTHFFKLIYRSKITKQCLHSFPELSWFLPFRKIRWESFFLMIVIGFPYEDYLNGSLLFLLLTQKLVCLLISSLVFKMPKFIFQLILS